MNRIYPEYWPRGTDTQRTFLQSPHRPVPDVFLARPWRTAAEGASELRLATWRLPSYPRFLDKTNLSRILTPWSRNPQEPSTIATRSRPWTLPGSPVAHRCLGEEIRLATWRPPVVLYPRLLDNTNNPRILTPRDRYPQDSSTIPTLSCSCTLPCSPVAYRCWYVATPHLLPQVSRWNEFSPNTDCADPVPIGTFYNPHTFSSLNFAWLSRGVPLLGVRTTFSHVATQSTCTIGSSIKRIYPEYWSRGPGSHWTLLQSPHGPVPELCLDLPWRMGAGGVRTTFSHMATPVVLYPRFLDKTNYPRILTPRARFPQDPTTIPTRSRPWALHGSTIAWRCLGWVKTMFRHFCDPPCLVPHVTR